MVLGDYRHYSPGGFGDMTVGGALFKNDDAANDFKGGIHGAVDPAAGKWVPASPGLISQVGVALGRASDFPATTTLASVYQSDVQSLAAAVDSAQRWAPLWWAPLAGRGRDGDIRYVKALNNLKARMQRYVDDEASAYDKAAADAAKAAADAQAAADAKAKADAKATAKATAGGALPGVLPTPGGAMPGVLPTPGGAMPGMSPVHTPGAAAAGMGGMMMPLLLIGGLAVVGLLLFRR